MANAYVQHKASRDSGSPITIAFDSNVTAGNLLVAFVFLYDSSGTISTPTDTQSNTWTLATNSTNSNATLTGSGAKCAMYYTTAGSTGACTVSFTGTGNGGSPAFDNHILEFSGDTTFDVAGTLTGAVAPTNLDIALTTATNNELLIGAYACETFVTTGSGFTSLSGSNVSIPIEAEYKLDAGAAGSTQVRWTTTDTAYRILGMGAAFKAAAPTTVYYYPGGANVTTGTWTTSTGSGTLASMIDEPTTPDDSDYIQSASNPTADICEIPLLNVQAPSVNTGHVIHYRLKSDASCPQVVKLIAGDGSTVVKTWSHTVAGLGVPNSTFTTYDQTLSTGEADAWAAAGYPGSRLRFTAN